MKHRCSSPKNKQWKDYGGRGIRVCPRWFGVDGLVNFLADMGPRPSLAHQLDRLDNDGNYEPENCCWSLRTVQCRNRRSNYLSPLAIGSNALMLGLRNMGLFIVWRIREF